MINPCVVFLVGFILFDPFLSRRKNCKSQAKHTLYNVCLSTMNLEFRQAKKILLWKTGEFCYVESQILVCLKFIIQRLNTGKIVFVNTL